MVLQMLYRGRAASGHRIWGISRRDFRTALPGASGAEFLPFLNSPRRSRAVTLRDTYTQKAAAALSVAARGNCQWVKSCTILPPVPTISAAICNGFLRRKRCSGGIWGAL